MAKARTIYAGTDDGLRIYADPGGLGRFLRAGHEWPGYAIRAVWSPPDQPAVVLAAVAGQGLQRSPDGRASWRTAFADEVVALAGHARAPDILYLADAAGRIFQGAGHGASWQPCAPGPWAAGTAVVRLSVVEHDPRRILVLLADQRLFAGDTTGDHWELLGEGAHDAVAAQGGALLILTAGAIQRRLAHAGWAPLGSAPLGSAQLVALAGPREDLVAAGATLARSDDHAQTWHVTLSLEPGDQVTALAPATYHPDTLVAGTYRGALLHSDDRGRTWEHVAGLGVPIHALCAVRLA